MTVNAVTLARISNNDLYGCSTGYQDYTTEYYTEVHLLCFLRKRYSS
jgi:hypothetical protein